ncbi:Gfo/Idh/MocA family protein [Pseudactinotalea sp. Z1732]|uniref:Gfo/Idh/MocA family protein n=1 Tax=Pseudactinotalea sp. Z1732 TaxID=3413026 RepID=UPI003C7A6A37
MTTRTGAMVGDEARTTVDSMAQGRFGAVPGKVRLGIIGLGVQGTAYARMIAEGMAGDLVVGAVADIDEAVRTHAQEVCPGAPFYTDYREMIAGGDVDAVVTTVPHYLHPQMGIDAIKAGVHVLVDKPAGVYTAQVRELNEVAAAHPDVTFAIMFNQRNNPLYQRIKEIVDGGEIGAIRRSNWIITTWWRPDAYYGASEWRATWGGEGGGVLVNQAPHQLDLWQWICGMPTSLVAKAAFGFRRDIVVEDEVTVLADYGDGVTGVFVTATHDPAGTDRLELLGDRGKIVVEGSKTATLTRFAADERELSARLSVAEGFKLAGGGDTEGFYTTEQIETESAWGSQHAGVLANFASAVLHGTELLAPGADGINGVRLANAVHLSAWLGQEVALDFDEAAYLRELNARIREEGLFPERPDPGA